MADIASPPQELPPSSSPALILTHPSPAERERTWTLTHPFWGPALSVADYLGREAFLTTVPLARDGGITHWVLTDAGLPPGQRRVYASCETLRKRAFVSAAGAGEGGVREGVAHGIGSVFTEETLRGRGYASRMMEELGRRLRRWDRAGASSAVVANGAGGDGEQPESLFSVLYSDVGKKFYARSGWAPFASSHVEFPPLGAGDSVNGTHDTVTNGDVAEGHSPKTSAKPIETIAELAELCALDEKLLRARLAFKKTPAEVNSAKATHVALIPDLDTMQWHLQREEFMTKHVFGRKPTVHGAVFGKPGKRVWGIWTRAYYGNLEKDSGNTLHFLRFATEADVNTDSAEGHSTEYLAEAMRAIVQIARSEATPWACRKVEMWNPPPNVMAALKRSGLPFKFVDRDSESIASLMWYGETPATDLDWVLNEKYGWC